MAGISWNVSETRLDNSSCGISFSRNSSWKSVRMRVITVVPSLKTEWVTGFYQENSQSKYSKAFLLTWLKFLASILNYNCSYVSSDIPYEYLAVRGPILYMSDLVRCSPSQQFSRCGPKPATSASPRNLLGRHILCLFQVYWICTNLMP